MNNLFTKDAGAIIEEIGKTQGEIQSLQAQLVETENRIKKGKSRVSALQYNLVDELLVAVENAEGETVLVRFGDQYLTEIPIYDVAGKPTRRTIASNGLNFPSEDTLMRRIR